MTTGQDKQPQHYLVGGGIASLAAAVFLVRDAGVRGADITIFEKEDRFGGSLDGAGDESIGYLVRGGRMFEKNFVCTFDLLASIPSGPDDGAPSVKDDILAFNKAVPGSSKCRLIRQGAKADTSLGLGMKDIINLTKLTRTNETALGTKSISECFPPSFFQTNFWIMWSTMFAFQPWHSAAEFARYLKRFIHLLPGFTKMEGVLRTRFNQYDSLIMPILNWLKDKGVRLAHGVDVRDARLDDDGDGLCISALEVERDGRVETLVVSANDRVYFTLGSMTAESTSGSNTRPPPQPDTGNPWPLWRRLASKNAVFGRPDTFRSDIDKTGWTSFSVTLNDYAFVEYMEQLSGNRTGTGGLVTLADSGWMMSFVIFHQPHFRDQADKTWVFWGYGLRGDRPGDFVKKPLAACCGDEILEELAGQLRLGPRADDMFRAAIVRPCHMPFITSQFMPRRSGDRPAVVLRKAKNFACMGQYSELSDDVVFTVEYSVRTAMTAVHNLAGGRAPAPVVRSDHSPLVLVNALRTLAAG